MTIVRCFFIFLVDESPKSVETFGEASGACKTVVHLRHYSVSKGSLDSGANHATSSAARCQLENRPECLTQHEHRQDEVLCRLGAAKLRSISCTSLQLACPKRAAYCLAHESQIVTQIEGMKSDSRTCARRRDPSTLFLPRLLNHSDVAWHELCV